MKKKNRLKVLFENIFIYGLFGSLEKVIPLIMLPIITRIITDTSEYGVYSMFTTIQSFGIQIAILGLYDAVFREYFEQDDNAFHRTVLSTALDIVIFASILLGAIMVVFSSFFSKLFLGEPGYDFVIYISAIGIIAGATRSILSLPIRIKNNRKLYIIVNFAQAILGYGLAIIMIFAFHLNYASLMYSSIISSILLTTFFSIYNRKSFHFIDFKKKEAIELLKIGLPLLPTFLIYWVFNSFDKIMVTRLLSLRELGIFTIGVKVASVSQILYVAFATGWQYFAFSTMKDDDQVQLTSKIMEYLTAFSTVLFLIATILDKPVFSFVFNGDYELGYTVFPFLFLAPLMLMVYQTGANQFLVYKQSYLSTICLSVGAVSNILMNYLFIMLHGIKGAALATLFGYLLSCILLVIILSKKKWINLSRRVLILLAIILSVSLHVYFFDNTLSNIVSAICLLIIIMLYITDLNELTYVVKNTIKNQHHKVEDNEQEN